MRRQWKALSGVLSGCLLAACALGLQPQTAPVGGEFQQLTAAELQTKVGQTGCPRIRSPKITATACIIGATACSPASWCCFAVPANQNSGCTPENENVPDPVGAWTRSWQPEPYGCVGSNTVSPCECGWTGTCYAGAATTSPCGTKSGYLEC